MTWTATQGIYLVIGTWCKLLSNMTNWQDASMKLVMDNQTYISQNHPLFHGGYDELFTFVTYQNSALADNYCIICSWPNLALCQDHVNSFLLPRPSEPIPAFWMRKDTEFYFVVSLGAAHAWYQSTWR